VQLVSKISNLCGPDPPTLQTAGQTDGQTTFDRKTALCTKVHRAVIILIIIIIIIIIIVTCYLLLYIEWSQKAVPLV